MRLDHRGRSARHGSRAILAATACQASTPAGPWLPHPAPLHDERVVSRPVPKLRLSGRWLEQCGFAVGDDLQVTVGRGMLLVSRRRSG